MAQVPIPEDWDGLTTQCYVVEWPSSVAWRAILFGLMSMATRGRYWDGRTGNIVDTQNIGREYLDRFIEMNGDGSMSCFDEIAAKLDCICVALQNLPNSLNGGVPFGSGGAGSIEAEPSEFVDNGTAFPAGYDDVEEYRENKCNLIEYIIEKITVSLESIGFLNLAGLTASGVVFGLGLASLIVAPVAFPVLVALAGTMVVIWAAQGTLQTAMNNVIDYFNALDRCILFASRTAQDAIDDVYADIDSSSLSDLEKQIAKNFITPDSVNILFSDKPPLDGLPVGDCSGCTTCESGFSIAIGSGPSIPNYEDPAGFTSAAFNNFQYLQVTSFKTGLPIRFVSISGWSSGNPPDQFRISDGGDGTSGNLYAEDTFPTGQTFDPGAGNIAFIFSGNGPFNVVLECGL